MHYFNKAFHCLCVFLALSLRLAAQTPPHASITGQILDPRGAAIVGAHIAAKQLDVSFLVRLVSDQTGRFVISNLQAGGYELHIEHTGFRDLSQQA